MAGVHVNLLRIMVVVGALCARCDLAAAQNQPEKTITRPDLAQRIVRVFDFEERLLHPLDVPRYWTRAQGSTPAPGSEAKDLRPGFPPFNLAELDYTVAYHGEGSVKLPVLTGSTSLRLNPGVLPIFANADYQISARVHTRGLSAARATISARFLDRRGEPIAASEVMSDPVVSDKGWTLVRLVLPGDYADAASIQMDLEALQPQQLAARGVSIPRFTRDDVSGAAWFDDVVVMQLPRIEFSTEAHGNITLAPQLPALRVSVRDLTGERLAATIIIQDAAGNDVDTIHRALDQGQAAIKVHPSLQGFGWYRAVLHVTNEALVVATSHVDFLYLPPGSTREERSGADLGGLIHRQDLDRFGVILTDLPARQEAVLPELLESAEQRWVMAPIWTSGVTPRTVQAEVDRLSPMIDHLVRRWIDVILCLDRVPADLARRLAGTTRSLFESTTAAPDDLAQLLDPFLDKFGQTVEQWQVGGVGDDSAFWERRLPERLTALERIVARLVPGPLLGLSWRLDEAPTSGLAASLGAVDSVVLGVSSDVPASAIQQHIEVWADRSAFGDSGQRPTVTVAFEPLAVDLYGCRAAAGDLVKRVVHAWAGIDGLDEGQTSRARLALVQPWGWTGERRPQTMPSATLASWTFTMRHLAGRRVTGRLDGIPGIVGFVLTPAPGASADRGSVLVAWAEGQTDDLPVLDMFLGLDPIQVLDVFGNVVHVEDRTPLSNAAATRNVRLALTGEPVFIEGVDPQLIEFLASLRMTPTFLRSQELDHECRLELYNPWPSAVTGRVSIVAPGGVLRDGTLDRTWSIVPRTLDVFAGPGERQSIPFRVGFSAANEAGRHLLVMELELASTRSYRRIRAEVPFEVGVEHLRADVSYRLSGDAAPMDVIVEVRIANLGNEPLTLEVAGFAEGFRRQVATVGTLQPSQIAVRHLIFPGASESLLGQTIAVRVEDLDTHARITKTIAVDGQP